jgi:hypothetical protein
MTVRLRFVQFLPSKNTVSSIKIDNVLDHIVPVLNGSTNGVINLLSGPSQFPCLLDTRVRTKLQQPRKGKTTRTTKNSSNTRTKLVHFIREACESAT